MTGINMLGLLDIKGNETVRRVYGIDGIAPTLTTSQGGNRQPKILVGVNTMSEINVIGRLEQPGHDERKRVYGIDGIAPTLNACGGGGTQAKILVGGDEMQKAFAMRGRYNEDGTISQQIEFRKDDVTSTLTGVQKDNMLMEYRGEYMQNVTVNDLFCGAGGMGLGFKNAGFEITGAWDFDKYAVESYRHNVGDHVQQLSILDMTFEDMPKADAATATRWPASCESAAASLSESTDTATASTTELQSSGSGSLFCR